MVRRVVAVVTVAIAAGCGRVDFETVARDAHQATDDTGTSGSGLVAYYAMEEDPTPGAIADSSGNGHVGTCTSCPTSVAGRVGNGYQFDGGMNHFSVVDTGEFQLTQGFTFALWINPTTTSGAFTVISKPRATGRGASCELALFSTLSNFCTIGATESCDPVAALTPGTWTHVALTWDGATKHAYFDGVLITSYTATTTFDSTPLVVGGDIEDGAFHSPYHGLLDEVRIYDHALSSPEIAALVNPT